ncbi:uncharacterized protein LOC122392679 isoform X4 [Amphibalanus amphitrite]|uniref:uncharacterized protein LOC122370578 isoform X5 n=1 Tax=Amphibalanus amphitrite TaxID=1232801 RepID=UPI001C8FE082|nr:uncharacterized protein LOC122370578 isoform X5 [Amphibalanus amphitrite]XP_043205359.1 uncharacterized protein LOC122372334 isoform X5 [Amphibalanus amphitrite]XP_043231912.1 uncharacterized protein LOC122386619 isoform X4 [Amphibalanus amphitrite]XP_043239034.1 uncharacterized protein LOC122390313 isoform X4 [Amphibalanus amphitrite]XP_043243642.1 uncharacterized protein LOC122392630 isoform X5 [Amphibalanus amphitrite]XP_043243757.1 uncharacterized protein LOC122392679 isoform X4 [Amphib
MSSTSDTTLVEAVRRHDVLWRPQDSNYFNRNKKKLAWEEVAKTTGRSVQDAKSKWKSLRDYHLRKRRQLPSGSGCPPPENSSWQKEMSFLDDAIKPKPFVCLMRTAARLNYQTTVLQRAVPQESSQLRRSSEGLGCPRCHQQRAVQSVQESSQLRRSSERLGCPRCHQQRAVSPARAIRALLAPTAKSSRSGGRVLVAPRSLTPP